MAAGFRPRGWHQRHRRERTERMLAGLAVQTRIQCNRSGLISIKKLRDLLDDLHAPPQALHVARGILRFWRAHGHPPIVFVGIGGTRWMDADHKAERVSKEADGICELAGISRTQALAGRDWLVEHQALNYYPPNGINPRTGHAVGGRGWSGGYSAGLALGGPDTGGVEVPDDREPTIAADELARRSTAYREALNPGRRRGGRERLGDILPRLDRPPPG